MLIIFLNVIIHLMSICTLIFKQQIYKYHHGTYCKVKHSATFGEMLWTGRNQGFGVTQIVLNDLKHILQVINGLTFSDHSGSFAEKCFISIVNVLLSTLKTKHSWDMLQLFSLHQEFISHICEGMHQRFQDRIMTCFYLII